MTLFESFSGVDLSYSSILTYLLSNNILILILKKQLTFLKQWQELKQKPLRANNLTNLNNIYSTCCYEDYDTLKLTTKSKIEQYTYILCNLIKWHASPKII